MSNPIQLNSLTPIPAGIDDMAPSNNDTYETNVVSTISKLNPNAEKIKYIINASRVHAIIPIPTPLKLFEMLKEIEKHLEIERSRQFYFL